MWTRLHWPIEKKEASYSKQWFRSRGKGIVSELSHDNKLQAMDPEMGEEKIEDVRLGMTDSFFL